MGGVDAGVIIAIITALAGLIVAMGTRRKSDAETNKATVEAVVTLIAPLTARVKVLEAENTAERTRNAAMANRVAALEAEVATLRERVAEFRRGVRLLCDQITQLGAKPIWQPDRENGDE